MLDFHLYIFFNDVPVQIFCPFLNQVFIFLLLNFMTSLYILDNNLLSDVFQKYFFLICYLSFESLDGAFHRAGIFNYNQVQTTNIFFSYVVPLVLYKKSLSCPRLSRYFPYILGVFIVWSCTFRAVIHFELVFMKSARSVSRFFFVCICIQMPTYSSTVC